MKNLKSKILISMAAWAAAGAWAEEPAVSDASPHQRITVDPAQSPVGQVSGQGGNLLSRLTFAPLAQRMVAEGGYFLVFDRTDGALTLKSIEKTRPKTIAEFQKQEIIFVNADLTIAAPDYRTFIAQPKQDGFTCWTGALRSRSHNQTTDYNPCESALTQLSANVGSYVANAVFTLGLGAVTGTGTKTATLDFDKVSAALSDGVQRQLISTAIQDSCDPGAVSMVARCRRLHESLSYLVERSPGMFSQLQSAKLEQYRSLSNSAKSITDLTRYHAAYRGDDPEGLAAQAGERAAALRKAASLERYRFEYQSAGNEQALRAFIQTYARYDPEGLVEEARSRLSALESKRSEQLISWRKTLKVGDDTHCGPIIEVRGPMIKIAVSAVLQGYAPEVWLKAEQVYPGEYGCSNTNGRLSTLRPF